jgi:hypothetical protein
LRNRAIACSRSSAPYKSTPWLQATWQASAISPKPSCACPWSRELSSHCVKRVFPQRHALRTQVVEKLVNAKNAGLARQQLSNKPAESVHIRDVVTLRHVPEDYGIDLNLKQTQAVTRFQSLGFLETAGFEIIDKTARVNCFTIEFIDLFLSRRGGGFNPCHPHALIPTFPRQPWQSQNRPENYIMKRFLFLALQVLAAMPCRAQLNYPPTKTVNASDTRNESADPRRTPTSARK